MSRRAQGMSINVVVIAAIALIILVILILIVVNSGKKVSNTAGERSCLAQGGECMRSCLAQPNYVNLDPNGATSQYCTNQNQNTPYCCRYNFGG